MLLTCVISIIWGINSRFRELFPSIRQIAYVLRTRSPVASNTEVSCCPSTCMYEACR